ncbi:MAG: hypothetical protein ACHQRJ_25550 [Alphaproteobacteria bacterium]
MIALRRSCGRTRWRGDWGIPMTPAQINAVYQYLCQNTGDPTELQRQLNLVGNEFGAVEAVLYLPMYSMGIGQAGVTPRIAALRRMGFTVEGAHTGRHTVEEIERLDIGGGKLFGMRKRISQLMRRAADIYAYGVERIAQDLKPIDNWNIDDLVRPFTCLSGFTGIRDKAALHVLMDLRWDVVKPDRHICRFLRRLGGQWERYFPTGKKDDLPAPLMFPFAKEWRDTCARFRRVNLPPPAARNGVAFPPLMDLSSRQIDILIMWFAQDRAREERSWRPAPICGKQAACQKCPVPDCEARARPQI